MKNSISTKTTLAAFDRGYRISPSGKIISHHGNIMKGSYKGKNPPYRHFSIKIDGKVKLVKTAKLQAYQKYGDKAFDDGVVIRHFDGDTKNETWDNILIGSASDNMMDINPDKRLSSSLIAARSQRRFSFEEIKQMRSLRESGSTLSEIGDRFGIKKSHVSMIVSGKLYKIE